MIREAITSANAIAPFSAAIVAEGRFVYVSGQGPLRNGEYVPGSIADETRLTLENIGALLEQAGSGFEHVVRCGIWLTDLSEFGAMNAVYETFFPDPKPARATVRADLVIGKIEIDCIGLVP